MGLKNILQGYVLALFTFAACGAAHYRYYNIELPESCYDQGKLLGDKPSDDLPFSRCKPDENEKGKCAIMFTDELFAAKKELLELRQRLSDCERGRPPQ